MSCTSRRLLLFQGGLSGASTGTLTYDGALYDPVLDRLITTSPDGDQIIVGGTGDLTTDKAKTKKIATLPLITAAELSGSDYIIVDGVNKVTITNLIAEIADVP